MTYFKVLAQKLLGKAEQRHKNHNHLNSLKQLMFYYCLNFVFLSLPEIKARLYIFKNLIFTSKKTQKIQDTLVQRLID